MGLCVQGWNHPDRQQKRHPDGANTPTPRDIARVLRGAAGTWRVRAIIGLLMLAMAPDPALASHGKVDQIEMLNGDRFLCEVTKLRRGKVTAKTTGFGTISIEWVKVARFTSPATYEVQLASGATLFGSLSSPAAGQLGVGGSVVSLSEVFSLTPIEAGFWQKLDGTIDLGFSFTQADQFTQWSLNSTTTYRRRSVQSQVNLSSLLQSDRDSAEQSRNTLSFTTQKLLTARWFGVVLGQLDQNESLRLDLRSTVGGGIGRSFVQTNRVILAGYAGVVYTREEYTGEPGSNRAEGVVGSKWDWFTFGDREIDLSSSVLGFVDLAEGSHVRVEIDLRLKIDLVKDLYWSVNLFESYNSAPPSGNKKNDLGITVALGWSY